MQQRICNPGESVGFRSIEAKTLKREILFYETDVGDRPVEEFLAGLDAAVRAKIVRTLELLRTQ